MTETAPGFERLLLKLSGEALMGERPYGLDPERLAALAGEIVEVHEEGPELAIVVGAGNIYRGIEAAAQGMDRATADYAGMLATLLNALALQDALERRGAHTRVLSALAASTGKSTSSTTGSIARYKRRARTSATTTPRQG